MFCICSNKSIDDILAAQSDIPLEFSEMLECYTSCLVGCGSCIPMIREKMERSDLLIEVSDREEGDALSCVV